MKTAFQPERPDGGARTIAPGRWRPLTAGLGLALALGTAATSADDTEIFFGQVDGTSSGDANVLFVLDTSGSMGNTDGTGVTRLNRMKEALYRIVEKSDGVNVGLMRFQGHFGGSAVIYPMTSIDGDACPPEGCEDVELLSRISDGADDTEEVNDAGGQSRGAPPNRILTMSAAQRVGLRFADLGVPQGATITSARIEFTATENEKSKPTLEIAAHALDDAPPFANVDREVAERPRVGATLWSPRNWKKDRRYSTVDVSAAVQAVVSRPGWCGGNAISFAITGKSKKGDRDAWSYERALEVAAAAAAASGDPNATATDATVDGAAALRVTYSPTSVPAGGGCRTGTAIAQVGASLNDVEQQGADGDASARMYTDSSDLELPRDRGIDQFVGLRFERTGIPKGVEILDARVEFQIDEYRKDTRPVSLWIDVEDTASPGSYDAGLVRDSDDRPLTGAPVPWDDLPVAGADGDKLQTPDLSSLIQSVIDAGDWDGDKAINLQLWRKSGEGTRTVESYDGNAGAAPKLIVRYRAPSGSPGAGADTSVKASINREILAIDAAGGTPIVDALYEAGQYYRGGAVDYGLTRGFAGQKWGSYRDYRRTENRISVPESWTGGTVVRSAECAANYPDDESCKDERIDGSPTYVSPMTSSCQTNHIVLLSDGSATSNDVGQRVRALPGIDDCASTSNWAEECGLELAEWLHATDHRPSMPDNQNVTVHTIGFNLESNPGAVNFAKTMAAKGGGGFYTASSADDLVAAFDRILDTAASVDTSFVAPGATVNQFNRLTHRDDIYFALFKPEIRPVWNGNLKRYKLGADPSGDGVAILDAFGDDAVDDDTGFFDSDARSYWSEVRDGADVASGGAAGELRERGTSERALYTYVGPESAFAGTATVALGSATRLHEDNAGITRAMLGLPAGASDAARAALLKRARGLDVDDVDQDGDTAEQIGHIGDPMHSRPVILNYDDPDSDDPDHALTTVFLGTNEGFLHAIERDHGRELWGFMPKELLGNLPLLAANDPAQPHPYGLDGTLSVWVDDKDNDNIVDADESAFLYVGMRRGGSSYYAFDVSSRTEPKLAWAIHGGPGGTTGFEELGQSWSRPIPTEIMVEGVRRRVIVFGAGYATTQDPNYAVTDRTRVTDRVGRGFYIVDARTGAPISAVLGANPEGHGFVDTESAMKHSVPGDIRVIDVDFDDLADQLWFGDTGGRVWRFDFAPYHGANDTRALIDGGVVAALGGSEYEDNRRFYYEPDISLVGTEGERFLSISIGSGWRAHPLNTVVQDRFYVLRSNAVYKAPAGYGREVDGAWTPITDADLTDVTNDLSPTVGPHGWYMDLEADGEKVLGDSITVNNQVVFTSYLPNAAAGSCESDIGGGRVYAVSVFDGSPVLDTTSDGDDDGGGDGGGGNGGDALTKDDRSTELVHGGIPPEPAALITENGPTILVGPEQPLDLDFDNLTQRSYWRDNGRQKPIVVSDGDGSEGGEAGSRDDGTAGGDGTN